MSQIYMLVTSLYYKCLFAQKYCGQSDNWQLWPLFPQNTKLNNWKKKHLMGSALGFDSRNEQLGSRKDGADNKIQSQGFLTTFPNLVMKVTFHLILKGQIWMMKMAPEDEIITFFHFLLFQTLGISGTFLENSVYPSHSFPSLQFYSV